uniref:Uncharacterized protein n=1 Tax=Nelumbo nucifera TaxID=4432 RepID=A0A822ZNQ0_NELNU|nr:TPA_asm: hypothetical protein HUJ06_002786 [Nelumbo nucifera]
MGDLYLLAGSKLHLSFALTGTKLHLVNLLKTEPVEDLAPTWWEFFHFQLICPLVDNFCYCGHSTQGSPRFVVAFRGTITKPESFLQDLSLDLHFIQKELHCTSRFQTAMEVVQDTITGHLLGSVVAMLAGKNMAKIGTFLKSFLINPPFFYVPIQILFTLPFFSLITAGRSMTVKGYNQNSPSEDPFLTLSTWVAYLFLNPADDICSEYVQYFEHTLQRTGFAGGQ